MKKSRTKKENCHLLCIHTARTGVVCSTKVERNDSGTQKISCCTSFQLDLFLFLSLFFDILNSLTWISIFYTSRVRWQSTKKPESAEKKWSLFLIFSLCVQKEEKKSVQMYVAGFVNMFCFLCIISFYVAMFRLIIFRFCLFHYYQEKVAVCSSISLSVNWFRYCASSPSFLKRNLHSACKSRKIVEKSHKHT